MVYTNNFKFFDKFGNNFNFKEVPQYTIEIDDVDVNGEKGINAKLEAVVNVEGVLIDIRVVNGGIGYNNPKVIVTDVSGSRYELQSPILIETTGEKSIRKITMDSNPVGFTYPAMHYEGFSSFEKISVNLIENSHVFILEEFCKDTSDDSYKYHNFPQSDVASTNLVCYLEEGETYDDEEAIFLFNVDYNDPNGPSFSRTDRITFDFKPATGEMNNGLRVDPTVGHSSLQTNIGFSFREEGVFKRNLVIAVENGEDLFPFVRIELMGETEAEDERFRTVLENFGIVIGEQEELIFRDSDVSEELPNYNLLNTKRKEMLLENHNIFPYIGSYKALVNIINYFGYYDLRIKEYWLNLKETSGTYLQYRHVDIPFQLLQRGESVPTEQLLPTSSFRKTDYFGLFYDINRETGTYDEWGVPETEDAFMFTIEEVLIKLFALKKYLKDKFLPLNARIIDITGEGVYFTRYVLKTWQDKTKSLDLEWKVSPEFETFPTNKYIVDITDYDDVNPPLEWPDGSKDPISSQYGKYVGNYSTSKNYTDDPDTAIGAPVELVSSTFDITWDEMGMSWNQVVPVDALITMKYLESLPLGTPGMSFSDLAGTIRSNSWNTIGYGEFIELEWKIVHEIENKYIYNVQGSIEDMTKHIVNLPYIGNYYITLTAIDLNNFRVTKTSSITVKLPNTDFITLARFYKYVKRWDDADIPWEEISQNWTMPSTMHKHNWNDMNLSWDAVDMAYYRKQDDPVSRIELKDIYDIWEASHIEGKIIDIRKESNVLVLDKQKRSPELKKGDTIFLQYSESIIQVKVTNINYRSYFVEITFDKLPVGISKDWIVLRTLVSNVILEGNQIYDPMTNPNGLKVGDFLQFKGNDDPEYFTIENTIHQSDADEPHVEWLTGIKLETPMNVSSGEFGTIFETMDQNSVNLYPISYLRTIGLKLPKGFGIETEHVIVFETPNENIEIRKGFTVLKVHGSTDVNVLVKNYEFQTIGSPGTINCIVDYLDIDSDLRSIGKISSKNKYFGIFTMDYRVNEFGTKVIPGQSGVTKDVMLNFNDYPFDTEFGISTFQIPKFTGGKIIPEYVGIIGRLLNFTHPIDTQIGKTIIPRFINTGTYKYKKNPKKTIANFKIQNLGMLDGRTIVDLDDENNELYSCNTTFEVSHHKFNEKYAVDHFGSKNITWENSRENEWNDLEHLVWNFLSYNEETLCHWKIMSIGDGGWIKVNDFKKFIFNLPTGSPPIPQDDAWKLAVDELNNSTNPGISMYQYKFMENSTDITTKERFIKPHRYDGFATQGQIDVLLNEKLDPKAYVNLNGTTISNLSYSFHLNKNILRFRTPLNTGDSYTIINYEVISDIERFETFAYNGQYTFRFPHDLSQEAIVSTNGITNDKASYKIINKREISFVQPLAKNDLVIVLNFLTSLDQIPERYEGSGNASGLSSVTLKSEVDSKTIVHVNGYLLSTSAYRASGKIITFNTGLGPKDTYIITNFVNIKKLDNTRYISAIAKLPGGLNLNHVEFDGITVKGEWVNTAWSHTYPIGNYEKRFMPHMYGPSNAPSMRSAIPNTYFYEGTDDADDHGWYPRQPLSNVGSTGLQLPKSYSFIDKASSAYRLGYLNAVASSFSWDDTQISQRVVTVPKMTTVFFNDENCRIVAKNSKIWRIYDENGKLLIETSKYFLIWKFVHAGLYDVELTITDKNGNVGRVYRKGFVKIT